MNLWVTRASWISTKKNKEQQQGFDASTFPKLKSQCRFIDNFMLSAKQYMTGLTRGTALDMKNQQRSIVCHYLPKVI